MSKKKQQSKELLSPSLIEKHSLLASSIPRYELLDFIQGESKDIAPYQCVSCESTFKRLSSFNIHNGYYRKNHRCPSDTDLQKLNLRKIKHVANGNLYDCWDLIPSVQSTGFKDELLLEKEKAAFPDFL
jgi:hypothetical protein